MCLFSKTLTIIATLSSTILKIVFLFNIPFKDNIRNVSSFKIAPHSITKTTRITTRTFYYSNIRKTNMSHKIKSHLFSSSRDLAIIGCGELGIKICQEIIRKNEISPNIKHSLRKITAITKTKINHEVIFNTITSSSKITSFNDDNNNNITHYKNSFCLKTLDEINEEMNNDLSSENKFKDVIFCVPPSSVPSNEYPKYPKIVRNAIQNLWAGPSHGGVFIFTSSISVYNDKIDNILTECTPTANLPTSRPIARLLHTEQAVLENNGTIVRLAELYDQNRGPPSYYLSSGHEVIPGHDNHILNLLQYDDAASACVAALQVGAKFAHGNVFLVSDGSPMTIMEICNVCIKTKWYKHSLIPKFDGADNNNNYFGKIVNGSWTNDVLSWEPRFKSCEEYFRSLEYKQDY